jgi:hypothetical protein
LWSLLNQQPINPTHPTPNAGNPSNFKTTTTSNNQTQIFKTYPQSYPYSSQKIVILWVFLDFENLILDFSIFGCCMGMKKVMEMGFNIHLCLIVGMF